MKKPRVLLADDHALVREGMLSILEPDYEVVGMAKDGRELVRIDIFDGDHDSQRPDRANRTAGSRA